MTLEQKLERLLARLESSRWSALAGAYFALEVELGLLEFELSRVERVLEGLGR